MGSVQLESQARDLYRRHVRDAPDREAALETICRGNPALATLLLEIHGGRLDGPHEPSAGASEPTLPELLVPRRPPAPRDAWIPDRYRIVEVVGEGGMSRVYRLRDTKLQRDLAMKVSRRVLRGTETPAQRGSGSASGPPLGRFLREARIMATLDHPGVLPVHEIGVNDEGRIFITMGLVQGESFLDAIRRLHAGDPEWSLTRAVRVLHAVCETLAYAHTKGIVHRDLKPANVMIGRFGQVVVLDWGLAQLEDEEMLEPLGVGEEEDLADPWKTAAGRVLGTPAYMPPEQARGELDLVGRHADVYAFGAVLYHLLSGLMPYAAQRESGSKAVLEALERGGPEPLGRAAPTAPAELRAICERAMARRPEDRYPDLRAVARELSAYLEGRVVEALEAGPWKGLEKWIQRNRAVSLMALAIGVTVFCALGAVLLTERRGREELLRLSDSRELRQLRDRADALWPAHPERVPELEAWLVEADTLLARRSTHRAKLQDLRQRGVRADASGALAFGEPEDLWWFESLTALVADMERAADPETGVVADVRRRLELARTIATRSLREPDVARRWREAIDAIADPVRTPAYDGLALAPQMGLVPIGPDPASGLWEFAHLQTGTVPERDPHTNALLPRESDGLVLVLLPGGTFHMGAQSQDPSLPGYDPDAYHNESPVHAVTLAPYFLSKYEMTQAQWERACGERPSGFAQGVHGDREYRERHPVEQIDWNTADRVLRRLGLVLPTEAQWEHGARGGTTTPWWTGRDPRSIAGGANIADRWCEGHGGPTGWATEAWLEDGWTFHSPVGSFRANGYGLHDTAGNLWEWTRDAFASYEVGVRAGDGLRLVRDAGEDPGRAHRGGSFSRPANQARVTARHDGRPTLEYYNLGVRPARVVGS